MKFVNFYNQYMDDIITVNVDSIETINTDYDWNYYDEKEKEVIEIVTITMRNKKNVILKNTVDCIDDGDNIEPKPGIHQKILNAIASDDNLVGILVVGR